MAGRWVDVGEAARELDVSTDAVRKRIARGSLESSREDGRILVWLDDGGTEAGREAQVDREALVEVLSEQVAYLKEQLDIRAEELREHRRIIAALTQRIPELPAAGSPPSDIAQHPEQEERLRDEAGMGARDPEPRWRWERSTYGTESERPQEPSGGPQSAGAGSSREEAPPAGEGTQEGSERPWWRRMFGG